MKYLKRFNKTSDYETFKSGVDYVTPNVTYINEVKGFRFNPKTKPALPAMAGDVAYWDGSKVKTTLLSSWKASLGIPIGVVVVPEGFAPDGRVRIIGLKPVDSNGNQSNSHIEIVWGGYLANTSLTNYTRVPTTDNAGSTSSGSDSVGCLPSDSFFGTTSFVDPKAKYDSTGTLIPSPYLGEEPNPEYYKELDGYNALSDFNGLSNTQTLVGLGTGYTAANAAYKYNDGASNLQWYLPAMGELGYLMPRFNEINNTITALGGVAVVNYYFWSSSERSAMNALYLYTAQGVINSRSKNYGCNVRPFTILDDGEDNESGGTSLEFPIYLVESQMFEHHEFEANVYTYLLQHYPNIPFSETPNNIENITEEIYVEAYNFTQLSGRVIGISLTGPWNSIALWTEGSKSDMAVLALSDPLSEYGSFVRTWYWD